ncbi:hypothetical protein CTI12_AA169330 [Artemisia annua]|uniref:Uncharacterized protein n=1 Tax=Artemisia annua TaxID=35608 RepID=A0A2U1PB76_ARTAN|nr:hypothetical protein CTI12_AA169330 [Artemisia annua]
MGQYHSSRTVGMDMRLGRSPAPIFGVNREGLVEHRSMSKMGQYAFRMYFQFQIFSFIFIKLIVLVPISKPTGFTGADPYKISFQVGKEKYYIPWLLVVNRKSSEVPMIDVHLRYSGTDFLGVTAKVVDMPHHYVELHPDIGKQFWDAQIWPKHVLVRYTWEEQSEIDVTSGFCVLFGSGLLMSFVLSMYVLQSSRDKIERFVRETVAENSSMPGGVAKVE